MYFCLICLFFVGIGVSGTYESPTLNPGSDSESSSQYVDTYYNTYNFHYGTGTHVDSFNFGNDDLTLSFSQQDALRRWQNSFDGMSGSARRNAIQTSSSPIELTLKQQCQLLTHHRGFFTPRYADASVCTALLGTSGDSARVGFSSTTQSGVNGLDEDPSGCDALGDICPSVTTITTPSVGYTVEGNVAVLIPQLAELGYNQEFLENDCVSESCTWPPFVFNELGCLCCQTTRGENALVVGLGPSVVVAKVAISIGNCVAKLQPIS